MTYARGMAALRLEMPDEVPHTQSITHPAWLEHLRQEVRRRMDLGRRRLPAT